MDLPHSQETKQRLLRSSTRRSRSEQRKNENVLTAKHRISGRSKRQRPVDAKGREPSDPKLDTNKSEKSLATTPGSFPVSADSYRLQGDGSSAGTQRSSTDEQETEPLFEAELVDPSENEMQRLRIRQEVQREVESEAILASEVVNDTHKKRRRQLIWATLLALTCLSVLGALVTVIVFLNKDNDVLRNDAVQQALEMEFGDWIMGDEERRQAGLWMQEVDTRIVYGQSTSSEFRQRYISCLLGLALKLDETLPNWFTDTSECDWTGLTCNTHGEIIGINLALLGLHGTIPNELGMLTSVKHISLFGNRLHGTLPVELSGVWALESFHGHQNLFSGTLPDWTHLENLRTLSLAENLLEGTLVNDRSPFPASLVKLDLSFNGLSGPLPGKIWHMQALEEVRLNHNHFGGSLPTDLGTLIELEVVHLQENEFSGELPVQIGALTQLTDLQAQQNNLVGTIPQYLCSLRTRRLDSFAMDCRAEVECPCCTDCF